MTATQCHRGICLQIGPEHYCTERCSSGGIGLCHSLECGKSSIYVPQNLHLGGYSGEWNDGWKTPRLLERSLVFVSLIQRRDVLVLFQRGWHWRYDVTPLDWSLLPSIISYLQQGVCQLKDVGHIGNLKETRHESSNCFEYVILLYDSSKQDENLGATDLL